MDNIKRKIKSNIKQIKDDVNDMRTIETEFGTIKITPKPNKDYSESKLDIKFFSKIDDDVDLVMNVNGQPFKIAKEGFESDKDSLFKANFSFTKKF